MCPLVEFEEQDDEGVLYLFNFWRRLLNLIKLQQIQPSLAWCPEYELSSANMNFGEDAYHGMAFPGCVHFALNWVKPKRKMIVAEKCTERW